MTTTRTALRRIAWIHTNRHATAFLGFVHEKITQAVERPFVHGTLLWLATLFRIRADFHQVLDHNRSTRRNRLNQLPTDNVIAIQAKPRDFVREPLQMSLRTIAAFALKRTLQSEIPAFCVFPGTFTKKSIIRCNGGTGDPEVHADNLPVGNGLYIRQSHGQVQPKPALADDQVSTIVFNTLCKQTSCIRIEMYTNHLPACDSCQRNTVPIKSIRSLVVSNGTDAASGTSNWLERWSGFATSEGPCNFLWKFPFLFDFPRESRLDCFSCLYSGGDHQLRWQAWVGFSQWIVGCLMQLNPILFPVLPSISRYGIETFCVLLNSFKQHSLLIVGGQQWKADGSLHETNFSTNILIMWAEAAKAWRFIPRVYTWVSALERTHL